MHTQIVNKKEMEENLPKQEKAMNQVKDDNKEKSMRASSSIEQENAKVSDALEIPSFMQTAVDEQDPDVCMAATSEGMLYAMEDQERQHSFEDQERQNAFDDSRYEQDAQNETAALNAAADSENFTEKITVEAIGSVDEGSEETDTQSEGVTQVGKAYHAGVEPFKNSQ